MAKYSNKSNRCHRERNTSRGNKGSFISCKVGGGRRPVSRRPLSPLARLRSGAGWPGAGFAAKGRRAGGRRSVEHYADGGIGVDLKWALWSEDRGFWDDYAPGVWEKMKKAFEGKSPELTLYTGPRKEIRYGTVSIWKGAARVHFYSVFDAPWELAVERVPEGLEEAAGESLVSFFEGHYGFSDGDINDPIAAEAGGVVKARTFDSLMKKIDAYEQKVLEETEWTGKAVDEHLKWFTEWTAEQGKKGSTARARKSGRSARRGRRGRGRGRRDLPVEPRRSSLARNTEVRALIKAMKSTEGYEVNHDKSAGTVEASFEGVPVYWAIQKGDSRQPWIVSYSTEYFG